MRLHISEPSQAAQRTHWISPNSRPATKVVDPKWDERLDLLGKLVVEMAGKLSAKVLPLRAEEQAVA